MTQVLDFLWGSIQYEDFAFLGLIERICGVPYGLEKLAATACRSTHSWVQYMQNMR